MSRLAALLLLAVFAILCVHGLRWDTPTVDEFAHLPSGWYTLQTGRFDLFPLNPPLVKVLSALPLLALNPKLDPAAGIENTGWYPWLYGTEFMEQNREIYDRIFLLARLPVLLLGLLLGWLVFHWARELYGDEAGLVALFLTVFFPSLIAHAHLATVDVGLCFFLLLALYLFWKPSSPGMLIACGVALGLAQLSKFTALILYPVFILLALRDKRRLASLVPIFLISLLVLNAGYLFQGIGRRAGDFRFESKLLSILPAGLPMPLPADYLEGLDALQLINDVGEYPEYLFGRWSREGSPAYYLVVILFKTPLPLLAALLLAPFARREAKNQAFLWLPALVLLAFFSTSKVHYGIRYVLPIFPLLFIYASRLVPWLRTRGRALQIAALILLLLYPVSALVSTPDTISYFNLLAGGQGDRILLDSNIDWGQGLKRVRAFTDREGIDRIGLAYFGHVDPALYGIKWGFPRPDRPGLVAVSANFLHGYPYATYAGGRMVPVPPDAFTWIAKYPRVADLGGGIFIYRIGPLHVPNSGTILPNMGTRLAEALFSPVQQRVLALLFGQPDRSFRSAEVIALADSGTGAVHRQLMRLADSGLVKVTRAGNQKHYQANPDSPVFAELHGLVVKTIGLAGPLQAALEPFKERIQAAFVYGSIAKGSDTARSDIDLMVICDDLAYSDLYEALQEAEATLGRPVHVNLATAAEWKRKLAEGNAFITKIQAQPKVPLIGSVDDLA